MNCPQCGSLLEKRVSFCPECGCDVRGLFSAAEQTPPQPDGLPASGLLQQIKPYIVYVVAACFIYSLFSVTTIRAGTENKRRTTGTSIKVPVTGINLLTGSFPDFTVKEYDDENVEITTKTRALAEMQPKDRRLVRTPWLLRTGYWALTLGVILLVLCRFVWRQPHVMYPVAVACGLLGSFAVIWVAGDVNRFAERLSGGFLFGRFRLSAAHSIGMWGLLLSYLVLFAGIAARTFRLNAGLSINPQKQTV